MTNFEDACSSLSGRMVPRSMRSQKWRRFYVVASYGLAAASVLWALAGLGDAIAVLGLPAAVSFTMQWASVNGLMHRRDDIDERERAIRDNAHRMAYQTVALLLFPLAVIGAGLFPERSVTQLVWAFVDAWLMIWGLPGAIVAWSEQDEAG